MQWRVGVTQGQPAPARYFHAAAVVGNRVYIFGTVYACCLIPLMIPALLIDRWISGTGYPIK